MTIVNMVGGGVGEDISFANGVEIYTSQETDQARFVDAYNISTASASSVSGTFALPGFTISSSSGKLVVKKRVGGVATTVNYPVTGTPTIQAAFIYNGENIVLTGDVDETPCLYRFSDDGELLSTETFDALPVSATVFEFIFHQGNIAIYTGSNLVPYTLSGGHWVSGVATTYTLESGTYFRTIFNGYTIVYASVSTYVKRFSYIKTDGSITLISSVRAIDGFSIGVAGRLYAVVSESSGDEEWRVAFISDDLKLARTNQTHSATTPKIVHADTGLLTILTVQVSSYSRIEGLYRNSDGTELFCELVSTTLSKTSSVIKVLSDGYSDDGDYQAFRVYGDSVENPSALQLPDNKMVLIA